MADRQSSEMDVTARQSKQERKKSERWMVDSERFRKVFLRMGTIEKARK